MTNRVVSADEIHWRHPDDEPPPKGTKLLLYLYPNGITIIGEWQHSGASLWAPMPRVAKDMKARLEAELGHKRLRRR
jgi:hypothetical protein